MGIFEKLFKKKKDEENVEMNGVYGAPEKNNATRRPNTETACVYASPEVMNRFKNQNDENRPLEAEMKVLYASPEMMGGNSDLFNRDNYPFNYAAENNSDENNVMNDVYAGPVEDIENDPFMKTVYDSPEVMDSGLREIYDGDYRVYYYVESESENNHSKKSVNANNVTSDNLFGDTLMFCPKCNAGIPPASPFCPVCGAKLGK